jgi:hypothetical protein
LLENCKFVKFNHSKISELFSIWYSGCISSVSYLIYLIFEDLIESTEVHNISNFYLFSWFLNMISFYCCRSVVVLSWPGDQCILMHILLLLYSSIPIVYFTIFIILVCFYILD